jgi:hypothetical protein
MPTWNHRQLFDASIPTGASSPKRMQQSETRTRTRDLVRKVLEQISVYWHRTSSSGHGAVFAASILGYCARHQEFIHHVASFSQNTCLILNKMVRGCGRGTLEVGYTFFITVPYQSLWTSTHSFLHGLSYKDWQNILSKLLWSWTYL